MAMVTATKEVDAGAPVTATTNWRIDMKESVIPWLKGTGGEI